MATIHSDGMAEDLIRTIQQLTCAEGHAKTLLDKYEAELNNGIIDINNADAVKKHLNKVNMVMEEIDALAEDRRAAMIYLFENYNGDKDYWCMFKHLINASYTAYEAYQASGDAKLLDIATRINKRFIKTASQFLGTEITDCAACFSDMLKSKS